MSWLTPVLRAAPGFGPGEDHNWTNLGKGQPETLQRRGLGSGEDHNLNAFYTSASAKAAPGLRPGEDHNIVKIWWLRLYWRQRRGFGPGEDHNDYHYPMPLNRE